MQGDDHDSAPPPYPTGDRPRYFSEREALYARREKDMARQRRLALAMMSHHRLGASAPTNVSNDVVQMVGSKLTPQRPKHWYPDFHHFRNSTAFVDYHALMSRTEYQYQDEFVCTVRTAPCEGDHWRAKLYHPDLNIILYEGQIRGGIQYASPPSEEHGARFVIELTVDRECNLNMTIRYLWLEGMGMRHNVHTTTYPLRTDAELTLPESPTDGEWKLRVWRARADDKRPFNY